MANYAVRLTFDSMPENRTRQFWYARNPASDTVIVFVHGILSSNRECWLHEGATPDQRVFWPDLVQSDQRLNEPSVYMGGYYTETTSGDYSVRECARELFNALSNVDAHGNPRPLDVRRIVFVCHSTGGIVVPCMLSMESRSFEKRAIGLALMATPTHGSSWANVTSPIAMYYNQQLALRLREGDRELELINSDFMRLRNDGVFQYLYGKEAYETQMLFRNRLPRVLQRVLPNRLTVVPKRSAGAYFDAEALPDTDHSSAVKPDGFEHPGHKFLVNFMRQFGERVELPPAPRASMPVPAPERPSTPTFIPRASHADEIAPHVTSEFNSLPLTQASLVAQQSAEAKPRIEELFDVITDSNEVLRAIFRTEKGSWMAPYEIDYVGAREGVTDVRDAIDTALRDAGRRLILRAPQGIGKTREIAELARLACDERSWTVLVARSETDARLGAVAEIPAQLVDETLLVVVDNLHSRILASVSQPTPYLERLIALLESVETFRPGRVWLLAAMSDEPEFQRQIGLPRNGDRWNNCGMFPLPAMTDAALEQLLIGLAGKAGVAVTDADAKKLVQNSDRKPETIYLNVCHARRGPSALADVWKPTEGESWKQRFATVRSDNAGVEQVFRAVDLLTYAGLPARVGYVSTLAEVLGAHDPRPAIDLLVGESLLGLRQDKLSPFGEDQLKELLGATVASGKVVLERADVIERAVTEATPRPDEWAADLLALARGVVRAGGVDKAEAIASRVIDMKATELDAFRLRASIRFGSGNLAGAETDLTAALAIAGTDAELYFVRASTRNLLGRYQEALADADLAIKYGRDDKEVHGLRATAYYQRDELKEANEAFTASVVRGSDDAMTYFARAMVRSRLQEWEGAEQDLTDAITRGIDLEKLGREIRQAEGGWLRGSSGTPAGEGDPAASRPQTGNLIARIMRGFARMNLREHALAEEDFTAALDPGLAGAVKDFAASLGTSSLPMLSVAKQQSSQWASTFSPAIIHGVRGMARVAQDKHQEAEEDLNAALDGGYADAEIYYSRAVARVAMQRAAEAMKDIEEAMGRGKNDLFVYSVRGLAHLQLGETIDAEHDFTKAIELGRNDPLIYLWRAAARGVADAEHAAEDLARVFEGRTPDGPGLLLRGNMYIDLRKFKLAEDDFNEAIELGFDDPQIWMSRGIARFQLDDEGGAEQDLSTAIQRGAKNAMGASARAAIYIGQDRVVEAEQDLDMAESLGRRDTWLFRTRGQIRYRLGRYPDAEADLSQAIALGETDTDVFLDRADARAFQRKWDDARADFDAVRATGRDDVRLHFGIGQMLRLQGRAAEAEKELDVAIARDDVFLARRERGLSRLLQANLAGAESDFAAAVTSNPDAQLLYLRGILRYAQGKTEDALNDYDASLAADPTNTSCLQARELAHLRLGAVDKGVADYQEIEHLSQTATETLAAQGMIALARGELQDGVQRFAAAAAKDQSWARWFGLALLLTDHWTESIDAYKQGLGVSDDHPIDVVLARQEFDFHTARHADKLSSTDAQAAMAAIRSELDARYHALGGVATS